MPRYIPYYSTSAYRQTRGVNTFSNPFWYIITFIILFFMLFVAPVFAITGILLLGLLIFKLNREKPTTAFYDRQSALHKDYDRSINLESSSSRKSKHNQVLDKELKSKNSECLVNIKVSKQKSIQQQLFFCPSCGIKIDKEMNSVFLENLYIFCCHCGHKILQNDYA